MVDRLPILDGEPITEVAIDGRAVAPPEDRPWAVMTTVSDRTSPPMGIPLVAGRGFTQDDRPGARRSPSSTRRWSAGSGDRRDTPSALGSPCRVRPAAWSRSSVLPATCSAPIAKASIHRSSVPSAQRPGRSLSLIVRAADPASVATAVRAQIRALDADVPVYEFRPFQQASTTISRAAVPRQPVRAFALLALVLAASGLYAVVSYASAQRVKEFGVRVALGAAGRDIVTHDAASDRKLVAIGVVLGLVGGRLLAIAATTLLYHVSASDPATYAGVALTLAAIALLATYIPVRRAMSIDPVRALRLE